MLSGIQKRIIQAIVNAFETGTALGDYGNVTLIPGDEGHLTYGRSQTTLGSGNLFILIDRYCAAPGCQFGAQLSPFLQRVKNQDFSLDNDQTFRRLLQQAGKDPVMIATQDRFFDDVYFKPALNICQTMGITTALGHAAVYDSCVHGSFDMIRDTTNANRGTIGVLGENAWVKAYLETRKAWVTREPQPFALARNTVFRMNDLLAQVNANNWDLKLPFVVHDVTINDKVVAGPPGKSPGSGFVVQGNFGTRGDFELVVPHPDGGLVHLSRLNDSGNPSWTHPTQFGGSTRYAGVSLIQSTFSAGGGKGNLEAIGRDASRAVLFWRGDVAPFAWNGPIPMAPVVDNVGGNAALLQGSDGVQGNFELVMPRSSGGFGHYWRDNDTQGFPWNAGATVGAGDGVIESLALIKQDTGQTGTLEVIARFGNGTLASYTRAAAPSFAWGPAKPVPLSGVPAGARPVGTLAAIQSRFGANGNFELLTPLSTGGLAHLTRVNDNLGAPAWAPAAVFGAGDGVMSDVALVQSNFGTTGSLEVIAITGRKVLHYWRRDVAPFDWSLAAPVIDL